MAPTRRRRPLAALATLVATTSALLGLVLVPAAADAAPAKAPNCGAEVLKADGTPWVCTFADEFSSMWLDTKKWSAATTDKTGLAQGGACYVTGANNVVQLKGTLRLTVRKVSKPVTCKSSKGTISSYYTAGQVSTYKKFAQQYGRVSVRAKFPAATVAGLHSALWMWPLDPHTTGQLGEVDIAEIYSRYNDRAVPYLHYLYDPLTVDLATNTNIFTNNYCTLDVTQFHDYTVEWTPTSFKIVYDDQVCIENNLLPLGTSPFDQPYFLILTQTLGIATNAFSAGTTPLPATTEIDWVHVWK